MKARLFFDRIRFVPIANLLTLLYYSIESMRYPGKVLRGLKLYGIMVLSTLGFGMVGQLIAWIFPYPLVQGLCLLLYVYGICLTMIRFIRPEVQYWQYK